MTFNPIHILPAGTHTDTNGNVVSFSDADLAATISAYNPAVHEAPLVIGHPKMDAPAYGWVQSLTKTDEGVEALPAQVNPDFAEMANSGAFKKRSASFYHPNNPNNPVPGVYYLRHIGFLGAQPPAIKGLRDYSFSETDECVTIEFSEPDSTPPANTNNEDTTVTPEEAAALQAKNAELETQLQAERTARAADKAARAHADNLAFAEQLAIDARIPRDDVPLVTAVLDTLQSTADVEFGEGDDAKPLHVAYQASLTALPQRVEFGEFATDGGRGDDGAEDIQYAEGTPQEYIDLDKKIRAHAKDKNISYAAAARAVATK